jgi:hypothetical protein
MGPVSLACARRLRNPFALQRLFFAQIRTSITLLRETVFGASTFSHIPGRS